MGLATRPGAGKGRKNGTVKALMPSCYTGRQEGIRTNLQGIDGRSQMQSAFPCQLALMRTFRPVEQEGIRAFTVPFFRPLPAPGRVANPMSQVIFQTTSKDGNDRMLEQP